MFILWLSVSLAHCHVCCKQPILGYYSPLMILLNNCYGEQDSHSKKDKCLNAALSENLRVVVNIPAAWLLQSQQLFPIRKTVS